MAQSRIHIEAFQSNVLQGNPLGDPTYRDLVLYLPPGYSAEGDGYPVLYLLAGYAGSGASFLNYLPWDENLSERMDRLIASEECRPMIIVMPDCFTRYGGSQYLNSSATGDYQSYLLEVVDFVDSNFNTFADRDNRAIAGKSSGGYGALMAAMEYPEIFSIVVDHSGDKAFELCYTQDLLHLPNLVSAMDVQRILADPSSVQPKGKDFFKFINMGAMSACYSPNPQADLGFDWPIDLHTGEIISSIWMRWKEKDPIENLELHADALGSLRLLYFDCGNKDEYFTHLGSRQLSQRLSDLNIKHTYEEFEGGHRHTQFRYDCSLPAISSAFPP
ncbi:MAG: esterase [Anaerolineales bacterium]|nr:esterase [Anaerolineales bacterium]